MKKVDFLHRFDDKKPSCDDSNQNGCQASGDGVSLLTDEKDDKRVKEKVKDDSSEKRFKGFLADFYLNLSKNGGMIYKINTYFVVDEDKELQRMDRKELKAMESVKGFRVDDNFVYETDARSKPGYVIINKDPNICIPLDPEVRSKTYFYNWEDALKEYMRLTEIEHSYAKKVSEVNLKVVNYLERIVEKANAGKPLF